MGYNKYYLYKKQYSTDNGQTWYDVTPLETTPSGDSIGSYPTLADCKGFPSDAKVRLSYANGDVYTAVCDSNTTLASGNTRPAGYMYSAMTSAEIGSCISVVGTSAFTNCRSLTSIDIPNSVTSIGKFAFWGCRSLTSIDIPDSVTTIADRAFVYCSGLTSVTIGSGVTSIDYGAFMDCSGLTSITIEATDPPSLGSYAFYDTNDNFIFYVPAASVHAYKTSSYWSQYTSRIQAIPTS